jgi:glycosyltransferase involved in cell wall biosynthesis
MPVRISIVVPVYNVAPYLERCITSLKCQSFPDIEIILVDDGSTDGSGALCDRLAKDDPRIRVIHQKNAGLSCARNAGLDTALGKYVMFVDSDDWVEPDYCALPYRLAEETGSDLVLFQLHKEGDTRSSLKPAPDIPAGVKTQQEALSLVMRTGRYLTCCGPFAMNKLYLRSLFEGNRYPEGMIYEDIGIPTG